MQGSIDTETSSIASTLKLTRLGQCSENTPIVFIHGWGNNSKVWQPLVDVLGQDREVLLIDLPGFGLNSDSTIEQLESLYQSLEKSLPPRAHLIGWSLGGMIATQLVHLYSSRFKTLTTIASNAKFVADDTWRHACASDVFEKFLQAFNTNPELCFSRFTQLQAQGDSARKQVLSFLRANQSPPTEDLYPSWGRALHWLANIDNRDILPTINIPHLAILGEKDALLPIQLAQDLVKNKMANKVEIIENASHVPHVSQTNNVADLIKKFIIETTQPYARNKKQVAKSFSAAAKNYDSIAYLQYQVVQALIAIKQDYKGTVLDLGCGTGFCIDALKHTKTQTYGIDIAEGMLKHCRDKNIPAHLVCGDIEQLPFDSECFDGLVSSFSLQWCQDLSRTYAQLHRVLKKDGWFLFSTLGPETLYELRQAWKKVDRYVHINQFESIENHITALEKNGFIIDKKISEKRVLEYDHVIQLMRELKGIGAHNVNAGQKAGLTTRRQFKCLESAYETFRKNGKLPASYEVYYFLVRAA